MADDDRIPDWLRAELARELDTVDRAAPGTRRYRRPANRNRRLPRLVLAAATAAALTVVAGAAYADAPPSLARIVHSELEWLPLPAPAPTQSPSAVPQPARSEPPATAVPLAPRPSAGGRTPEPRETPAPRVTASPAEGDGHEDRPSPTPSRAPSPSPSADGGGDGSHD